MPSGISPWKQNTPEKAAATVHGKFPFGWQSMFKVRAQEQGSSFERIADREFCFTGCTLSGRQPVQRCLAAQFP